MIRRRRIAGTRKPRPRILKPYPLRRAELHEDGRLTIFLPVPHRIVSPNASRGGSHKAAFVKRQATEDHRRAAFLAVVDALARFPRCGPFTGYSLRHLFKTAAFRDDDNADGACKAYRDGIAEALRMNDRDLRKTTLSVIEKDATAPRVEITLYPASQIQ